MNGIKVFFGSLWTRLTGAGGQARSRLNQMVKANPWRAVQVAVVGALAVAAFVGIGFWAWVHVGLPRLPAKDQIWAYNREAGVTFLDRNGTIIGVRGPSYGREVTLAALPAYVPQAFLAIEDRRFYEHDGVDNTAIVRAAMANLTAGRTVQGGSTISQQLAKNLFLTRDQTLRRKLQEMVLAARLEDLLTKDELLELYLNRVFLGEQAYGVDAAARRYFGKPGTELTLAEAAMIAGLPKAPSRTAPTSNFARAKERQVVVLDAMVEAGYITPAQRDEAVAEPINVTVATGEGSLGYVFDMAVEEAHRLTRDVVPDMVIELTVDPAMQAMAERAIARHAGAFANRERPLQAAMVVLDPAGEVRALIGGNNYQASKFNRAYQARRQPGSTFKAFVYAAALERGMDADDVRFDEPIVIQGWRPSNYDDGYRGAVTLRTAFALSLNTVAAEIGHETGVRNVAALAQRFGVGLGPDPNAFDDDAVPLSITLGSVEVSLWDMAQGFAVFMNQGRKVESHLVNTVQDARGQVLFRRAPIAPQVVFSSTLNEQMVSLLGTVVQRGTATRAQISGHDVAGKSGTSQNWRDAWFIGFTGQYTAGVWMGHDDFSSMTARGGPGRVTGGSLPAAIWHDFMSEALEGQDNIRLPGLVDQPRRTARDRDFSSFYDGLREALSRANVASVAAPPPPDFFRRD
ncbi:MAG: transglycosylase domain-containing protein [Caulobacterales bacterium]